MSTSSAPVGSAARAATAAAGSAASGGAVESGQQGWAKAYAQGQWSAAIELLETIPEASRTAWHWLHLARAFERRSQLVEAFAAYERVRDMAEEGAGVVGMREVERQARGESAALAGRIPWAEITLGVALPLGSLVFVDREWLEPTRLRSPYPVNPGWHTFLVEANGEVLAARRAFFEEGQTRRVPLLSLDDLGSAGAAAGSRHAVDRFGLEYDSVPSGGDESGAGAAGAALPPGREALGSRPAFDRRAEARANPPSSLAWQPAGERRPGADRSAQDDTDGLLRASYVSLGAGALGTLVGTGFLISTLNTRSGIGDGGGNCSSARCEQSAVADAARSSRNWRARASAATFSYAVGLAGLVTGGMLWLLHRESSSRPATLDIADLSLELAPRFSPHGATIKGTF